jgi:bifunctional non-homologous end joining protein LigD
LVFDLDPGPKVQWSAVVEASLELRELLEAQGLQSFVRTSGGKGLHVVLPIDRRASWDEAKAFARSVAETLAQKAPARFVSVASKARRSGRIFVDWLRNGRGATAIASYSTRARPDAPVATPLSWEELPRVTGGEQFLLATVPGRLKQISDPWVGFDTVRQGLPARSAGAGRRRRAS